MEPYTIEATVGEDGALSLTPPFAPGTKVRVTIEEAEPMDYEAFSAELNRYYEKP